MKALGSRPISVLLPQLIQWANIQSVHRAGFHADWLLAIIFTLTHTALNAIVVHEIPFIEDMGVSKVLAAAALGTMTLMSAPGRLFGGWLADRWNLKYLYAIASVVQAGGLFIFSRVTSMSWVWGFVVIYGLSYGLRIPLEPVMRANLFGWKAFGSIMGYINAFAITGSFAGPYFAGWVFDTTGRLCRRLPYLRHLRRHDGGRGYRGAVYQIPRAATPGI